MGCSAMVSHTPVFTLDVGHISSGTRRSRTNEANRPSWTSPSGSTVMSSMMRTPWPRRSAYAVLTAKGRSTFRQAAPTYLAGIGEQFGAALTPAEMGCIKTGLDRVISRATGRSPA